jgi:hypothetical protein
MTTGPDDVRSTPASLDCQVFAFSRADEVIE